MPTTTVNGIEMYYERHGERGDPLVLMHGYTGDVTDWRFQLAEFSATHRVLVFDHRGHGRSEAPADRGAYSIDQMSHDAEALIAHAGRSRKMEPCAKQNRGGAGHGSARGDAFAVQDAAAYAGRARR
jgi:pimeloyl-ACP methyl ester carboxylesterase